MQPFPHIRKELVVVDTSKHIRKPRVESSPEDLRGITMWVTPGGEIHRTGGPAVISPPENHQAWYRMGKIHRAGDKPARVWGGPNATDPLFQELQIQEWWVHGKLHRTGGPARIESHVSWARPREHYFQHGARHRVGGPASTWEDGSTDWFYKGERHRLDGPAVIRNGVESYYIEGVEYPKAEWCNLPAVMAAHQDPEHLLMYL